MDDSIRKFIEKQKCASICCVNDSGEPYCFSSFYVFNGKASLLYFKSSADTNHIRNIKLNPLIAGTILPDKMHALVIKGIQFQGTVLPSLDERTKDASMHYHAAFPFALAVPGEIWTIQLTHIKMTDSTLGFGAKVIWDAALS